jgi:hypothetical protein
VLIVKSGHSLFMRLRRLVAKRLRSHRASPFDTTEAVTIRWANAEDASALARLAALDDARLPEGQMLVAEVEGELRAALAVSGKVAIANPFRPTAELVSLLALRADQISTGRDPRSKAPRRGPTVSEALPQTNYAGR